MTEKQFKKGDYTYCGCSICEIVDEYDEVVCNVATEDVEKVIEIFNNCEKLQEEVSKLTDLLGTEIEKNVKLSEENQNLMKAVSESSRIAVDTLLPKDEDTMTLKGHWW